MSGRPYRNMQYCNLDLSTYTSSCPFTTKFGAVPVRVHTPPIFAA